MNPRSLRNLRPFQKGRSGNPGARPKSAISEATRDWLKLIDPNTGKSNAELVAQALGTKALKGETAAYCAIRDTTEGRPAQTLQHEIISSSPLKVRVSPSGKSMAWGCASDYSPQTSEENRC